MRSSHQSCLCARFQTPQLRHDTQRRKNYSSDIHCTAGRSALFSQQLAIPSNYFCISNLAEAYHTYAMGVYTHTHTHVCYPGSRGIRTFHDWVSPPSAGLKFISNSPGPLAMKSVALYWSPNACRPTTMGLVHPGVGFQMNLAFKLCVLRVTQSCSSLFFSTAVLPVLDQNSASTLICGHPHQGPETGQAVNDVKKEGSHSHKPGSCLSHTRKKK